MNKKKELKVFEGFAGYGGGSFALKKLKKIHPEFKYNVVAYSEIDKFASALLLLILEICILEEWELL